MPLRRRSLSPAALVLVLASHGLPSTSWSQASTDSTGRAAEVASKAPSTLDEVVVTAQRRSEKLQDLPASVESFNADQLQAAGVTSTADLSLITPGFVAGEQPGYAQPFLRGVGTVAISAGIENPVALYVDDVYYSAIPGAILTLANVAEVEVEKGPQGTLFGRNATGGLIKVTTKDPCDQFGGLISATYGNYQTAGTDFYLTGLVAQNLTANLAVYFQNQGNGYGVNLFNGEPVSKTQDLSVRNKWLLKTGDGTETKLTLDYEQTSFIPNYGPAPGTTALGAPNYRVPPQDIAGFYQPFGEIRQGGASLDVTHDFDFAKFLSITAYRQTYTNSDSQAQLSVSPLYSANLNLYEQHKQESQEFILSSASASDLQWTAGTYLYSADGSYSPTEITTGGLVAPLLYYGLNDDHKTYSAALYGQATLKVQPDTNVTLGLRYTAERTNFSGFELLGLPGSPPFTISDSAHKIFKQPTWRLALDHHFTPDIMSYISYNRGFKSGSFNDSLFPAVSYAPETLDDYEIGSKLAFLDHRVTVDAAGFLYKYKNIQEIQYLINPVAAYIYSGATARLYGFDIDTRFIVIDDLVVILSAELIRSKFTSFADAPISSPMLGGGTAYATGSVAGNQLPLTPKETVSLGANYTIQLSRWGKLIVNGTYSYDSGWYGEPDNRLHQPAYSVFNSQVAWHSGGDVYQVRLWAKNLTNTQYTTSLGSQPNGDFAVFAAPRTFGVTLQRNF